MEGASKEESQGSFEGVSAALLAVLCMSGENDDIAKVRFVADAARSKEAVFDKQALLDKDLLAALEWAAARSAPEVRKAREAVICAVEHLAEKLVKRRNGVMVLQCRRGSVRCGGVCKRPVVRAAGKEGSL